MASNDSYSSSWEESYSRKENFIFFPKEEVVKFLNRFVAKRTGANEFNSLLDKENRDIKALDLGCGIGRQTILFRQFGFDAYGVDISSKALDEAEKLASNFNYDMNSKFLLLEDAKLPFHDSYFDIAISDSVLDSMNFNTAMMYMNELNRTVRHYVYLNLISSEGNPNGGIAEDTLVSTMHEKGTIQSYYDENRIEKLISDINFVIKQLIKNTSANLINGSKSVRFHVVLEKKINA